MELKLVVHAHADRPLMVLLHLDVPAAPGVAAAVRSAVAAAVSTPDDLLHAVTSAPFALPRPCQSVERQQAFAGMVGLVVALVVIQTLRVHTSVYFCAEPCGTSKNTASVGSVRMRAFKESRSERKGNTSLKAPWRPGKPTGAPTLPPRARWP